MTAATAERVRWIVDWVCIGLMFVGIAATVVSAPFAVLAAAAGAALIAFEGTLWALVR